MTTRLKARTENKIWVKLQCEALWQRKQQTVFVENKELITMGILAGPAGGVFSLVQL